MCWLWEEEEEEEEFLGQKVERIRTHIIEIIILYCIKDFFWLVSRTIRFY